MSDLSANQIGRKLRHPLVLIVSEAVYDCDVVAFYIGGLLQALVQCAQTVRDRVRRCVVEKSDHGHCLLREHAAGRKQGRRGGRAAEQRYELAPVAVGTAIAGGPPAVG